MKRLLALLLCAILVLTSLSALAAEYTLDEKLFKQVKDGSGLRVTLATQKTGGAFSVLDAATNAALNVLLPGAELSLRYLSGVGTLKGREETELILTRAGQPLADLRLLKDSQFEQLTSSLLGASRYVDRRDGGVLGALFSGSNATWPGIEGVLLKLNTAESTWQGQVATKLDAYLLKLTVWLQGYTKTESLRDAQNQLRTRITLSVPPAQLKAQIKQLLLDAYSDTELLALLSQELDARQAAAWLQPGMMNSFFQALDRLPLTENVESLRLLDAQGQLLQSTLTLPMGGAQGLQRLLHTFTANAQGGQTSITLEHLPKNAANQKGAVTSLVYTGGQAEGSQEHSYIGTLSLQPEATSDAFTVDVAEGDVPAAVYTFNLLYAPEDEVVDRTAQTSTRDFSLTLRLVPQGTRGSTAQLIKADVKLQSRLNSRSATYFTGTLTWQDEGSQALITAQINGNSAPPWAMDAVAPEGAIRVDTLSATQLSTLSTQLQSTLQSAFTALLARLALPVTTTP